MIQLGFFFDLEDQALICMVLKYSCIPLPIFGVGFDHSRSPAIK